MRNGLGLGLDGRGRCDSRQVLEALPENAMWTPTTRAQHKRAGLRYGSDLTDAEWLLLSPLLPPPHGCGRHRKWEMPRDRQRHLLRAARRDCLEPVAAMLPTLADGLSLVRPVPRRRDMGGGQPST